MKNALRKKQQAGRAARRSGTWKWLAAAGVAGLLVYGVTQMSGVAYTDADMGVIDFSSLDSTQKRSALQAANQARCTCGCRLGLAQCIVTDSTCPIRDRNIDRVKVMVEQAKEPRPGS